MLGISSTKTSAKRHLEQLHPTSNHVASPVT